MSSFTTPLLTEKLNGGRHFRIIQEFTYKLGAKDGPEHIDVPIGEVTDFGSIPWFLRWLVDPTGTSGKAFVIHDRLYNGGGITHTETIDANDHCQLPVTFEKMRYPSRKEADFILLDGMRVLKEWKVIRGIVYIGVRVGGWYRWEQVRKEKVNGNG
jgi:hypothetical protein